MKSEQAELISRAGAGDLDAFERLYREYGRRILNFVYRMVDSREDAEDLTQVVFLRAFHELGRLQKADRFESWLYRIARNEVYQAFRKKRSGPTFQDGTLPGREADWIEFDPVDRRPTPHQTLLQAELGVKIRTVLNQLPPKLREVFVLSVIHEKSYTEIAEIVGRTLLSVKTDIFRARSFARRALGQYLEAQKR